MPANEIQLKKNNIIESGNEGLESFGTVQLGFINKGTAKPFLEEVIVVHELSLPPVLGLSLEAPPPPPWCLDLKIIPGPPVLPPFEFGPVPPLSPLVQIPLKPGIPPVYPGLPTSASPPLTEILPPPSVPPLLVTAMMNVSPPGAFTHYSRPGTRYKIIVSGTVNAAVLQEGLYSYFFYIHKGTDYQGPLTVPLPFGISPLSRIARVGIGFTVASPT